MMIYVLFISKWNMFCSYMITPKHHDFVLFTSIDEFIQQCEDIFVLNQVYKTNSNEDIDMIQDEQDSRINTNSLRFFPNDGKSQQFHANSGMVKEEWEKQKRVASWFCWLSVGHYVLLLLMSCDAYAYSHFGCSAYSKKVFVYTLMIPIIMLLSITTALVLTNKPISKEYDLQGIVYSIYFALCWCGANLYCYIGWKSECNYESFVSVPSWTFMSFIYFVGCLSCTYLPFPVLSIYVAVVYVWLRYWKSIQFHVGYLILVIIGSIICVIVSVYVLARIWRHLRSWILSPEPIQIAKNTNDKLYYHKM
eukprot:290287_1